MASTTVTLGGTNYDVPKLNIGQLEQVSDAFQLPLNRRAFAILRIGMSRVEPKVDTNAIEADDEEVALAVKTILTSAGYKTEEKPGPNPAPPAPGVES